MTLASVAIDRLHLIVMPTEDCNFRCTYCYEDFAAGRMSPEVVRRVKRLLARRASSLRRLTIAWFGGEPLLALDVVEDIQRCARELCGDYPGLRLDGSMTTNGFRLDGETFARLVDLGVTQYQITFDGPPDAHDRKRLRRGGQGSFDRIWANLESAAKSAAGFEILVRVHIHEDDLATTREFVDRFKAAFGCDTRFRFAFVRVGVARTTVGSTLPIVGKAERYAAAQGLNLVEPQAEAPICYASRANSYVVRSDGRIGKCTVALDDERNSIGRIREDGQLQLDDVKLHGWMRGLTSGDPTELGCPKRGFADGPAGEGSLVVL